MRSRRYLYFLTAFLLIGVVSLVGRFWVLKRAAEKPKGAEQATAAADELLPRTPVEPSFAREEMKYQLEDILFVAGKELKGYRPGTEEDLLRRAAKRSRSSGKGRRQAPPRSQIGAGLAAPLRGEGARAQLKTATKIGAYARIAQDVDAQLVLSRAFVTGEDPNPAIKKTRETAKPAEATSPIRGIVDWLLKKSLSLFEYQELQK